MVIWWQVVSGIFVPKISKIHKRIKELKLGAKVERRRREPSRGAEGAKGVQCGEGVSPSPQGEGSSPEKFF